MRYPLKSLKSTACIISLFVLTACGSASNSNSDTDNDGYSNDVEISEGSNPADASSTPADQDGDFIPDSTDMDIDGDGIENKDDALPNDSTETLDTDGDKIGNSADTDDDGDGYSDLVEAAEGTDPLNDSDTPLDQDKDFIPDSTDTDDDNDNWSDTDEVTCNTDSLDSTSIPTDTDNDASCNVVDKDDDNDGYSDDIEITANTDPLDSNDTPVDTDGDFIPDNIDTDLDGDSVANETDIDADGDGLIEITTLEQFDWIRNDLTGSAQHNGTVANTEGCTICNGYELMSDLNFDTNGDGVMDSNDTYFDPDGDSSNFGWLPIGSDDIPFLANFEGNHHTIYNLYINRPERSDASGLTSGLFARIGDSDGAILYTIQNLALSGDLMSVSLRGTAGALVGHMDYAVVDNCSSSGTFTAASSYSGGLVGYAENNSIIKNSFTTGSVSGSGELGGLLGYSYVHVQVLSSYSTATVTSDSSYVGGLVGYTEDGMIIRDSYATGDVTVDGDSVGGLVGWIDDEAPFSTLIINSYATGNISSTSGYVGGLVGEMYTSSHIYNSYATGNVSGTSRVGGLVGYANDGLISSSYATGNVVGTYTHTGGLVGRAYAGAVITASFATGSVNGNEGAGGLVGGLINYTDYRDDSISSSPRILNSYSTAEVTGSTLVGGLVGQGDVQTAITNSYWATDSSTQNTGLGNDDGVLVSGLVGVALSELSCPVNSDNSSCASNVLFSGWGEIDHDDDAATQAVSLWSFNSDTQLPSLLMNTDINFDRDGDGIKNPSDAFPDDASETFDTDGDGDGNNTDLDDDGDGYSDSKEGDAGSDSLNAASTPLDTDGDGYGNLEDGDLFPDDVSEWADNDDDGTGDNRDSDDDNDGTRDSQDVDSDGDGLIEIGYLAPFNLMRNDLAGTSLDGDSQGCNPCNGYELLYDIDFDTNGDGIMDSSDTYFDPDGDGSNKGWTPIGDRDNPFVAIFEGNGHTIKNLYINQPTSTVQSGLFGRTGDSTNGLSATIKNVALSGDLMSIIVNNYAGALVGWADNTLIDNCSSTGNVTGNAYLGGLVGSAESGTVITNSNSTGNVNGTEGLGGLVAYTDSSSGQVSISGSYATGNVTGTGSEVGGLIGYTEVDATISNSYATGAVAGGSRSGGLIGHVDKGFVTQSYATGAVSGTNNVGGLIGYVHGGSTITASYAQGSVEGNDSVGGLGGYFTSATVTASYATGLVTGSGSDAGGLFGLSEKITVNQSYWASDATNMSVAVETFSNTILNETFAVLLSELQCPTSADDSGCASSPLFVGWDAIDHDSDADTATIAPWNFNAETQLPTLKSP